MANIFSDLTNYETTQPSMLNAWNICQVSLVRCTNDWHNRHSGWKLILHIPTTVAGVDFTIYSATSYVCNAHWFKIKVLQYWGKCQKELNSSESITVVQCSKDRLTIFNPTKMSEPESDFREERL
jgi:hypothetical protein